MAVGPNLFDMTESTVNSLKKPEIGKKIMKLKVVVAEEIKSHCIWTNRYSKSTFIQKWKTE